MNLKSKHKADPSFNMSSMTDIVFLLLIFFMLTSSVTTSGIKINIPSASITKPEANESIKIAIDKDLNYFIDGEPVKYSAIKQQIKTILKKKDIDSNSLDYRVVVKGDKEIKYDEVMKVVSLASEVGGVKVTLATSIKKK